jgi:outer membrane protein OmpA-like peptidoglycan-associated protein/ABC-type taurine transport system substrate-binding protein
LLIAAIGAVAWRTLVRPRLDAQARQAHEQVIAETSGDSRYRHNLNLALDEFSGYAILRSTDFRQGLRDKAIRLNLVDDKADYNLRLRRLQSGDVQMAAFTIDALIKASANLGDLPAVIVGIIDETRGADAMVAAKARYPNVDSLNDPATRFVLTGNSPSETLTRVVMTHFSLSDLAQQPLIVMQSPQQVIERYRQSPPNSVDVFVVWEPFVSEILENDAMHVVVDSSRFRGYIVDVIVVGRDFLLKNEAIVRDVMASYFTAAYNYRQKMVALVFDDAQQQNASLTQKQAEKLVEGIRWKNTQENFAHFGILTDSSLQHIEDMIANITKVLMQTSGIQQDPTGASPAKLFNQRVLRELRESSFHPGLASETIQPDQIELPALSEAEWTQLREVGELEVPNLVFARGTTSLTTASLATLDELVGTLNTWPQYYLRVRGNASQKGDLQANRQLAQRRAQAAADYLIKRGIHPNRIHAIGGDPSGDTSVSFLVGEAPY